MCMSPAAAKGRMAEEVQWETGSQEAAPHPNPSGGTLWRGRTCRQQTAWSVQSQGRYVEEEPACAVGGGDGGTVQWWAEGTRGTSAAVQRSLTLACVRKSPQGASWGLQLPEAPGQARQRTVAAEVIPMVAGGQGRTGRARGCFQTHGRTSLAWVPLRRVNFPSTDLQTHAGLWLRVYLLKCLEETVLVSAAYVEGPPGGR